MAFTFSGSFTDFDNSIRKYIKMGTLLDHVITANSNSPAPTTPYATAQMISNDKIGIENITSEYRVSTDDFLIANSLNYNTQYRIQIYNTIEAKSILEQLLMYSFRVLDNTDIKDISAITGSNFENRASVEINFFSNRTISAVVNRIDSVEITTKFDNNQVITTEM